ncbi:MAG TPA: hypothetical protein DCQ93_01640 [Bacteroidetes bacterium]|nr:hypothetical protein [Bacteroidota bacterium]
MEESNQPKSAEKLITDETKIDSRNLPQYKELLLEEAQQRVNLARNWMYFIGGINLTVAMIFYFQSHNVFNLDVIVQSVFGFAFFGFAIWVRHQPRVAVVSGMILYLAIISLTAMVDLRTISSGIIFKVMIIYAFVRSMKAATEVENLRDELGKNRKDISDLPIDMIK